MKDWFCAKSQCKVSDVELSIKALSPFVFAYSVNQLNSNYIGSKLDGVGVGVNGRAVHTVSYHILYANMLSVFATEQFRRHASYSILSLSKYNDLTR